MVHLPLKGVMIDADGTLFDTWVAHASSWHVSLAEAGIQARFTHLWRASGCPPTQLIAEAIAASPNPQVSEQALQAIVARGERIFRREYLSEISPTRGAARFIERLRSEGLKLSVTSTCMRKSTLDDLMNRLGHRLSADELVGLDEIGPTSTWAEVALNQMGLYPAQVQAIGSTPYDVDAAIRSGIHTVGLRCGGWDDHALEGAIAHYDHPQDLLENFETSVLASAMLSRKTA